MKRTLPLAAVLTVMTVLVAACSSGGGEKKATACGLVTPRDISVAIGEQMTKSGGSGPVCAYSNGATRHIVTVTMRSAKSASDARTQLDGAATAIGGTKAVKGVGDKAVVVVKEVGGRASATVDFVNGKTLVLLLVAGDQLSNAEAKAVALAKRVAPRA